MAHDFIALANSDPVRLYKANIAQIRFYQAIQNPKKESLTVVLLLKGNRAGGSWGLVTAWSAIMFGTSHKHIQGSPFNSKWPFVKSARLASPMGSLGDKGPIQSAIASLFPPQRYIQGRGAGKGYYSQGSTDTGWTWDVLTYDQAALQAAGANKGLILMSEPPPQNIFTECLTRLSGNGLMIVECTRLDMADYLDEYVDAGGLILDGKKVGEVRVVEADIHDACREHSNGHMAHSAIEATIAGWPIEEREARKTGKRLAKSGRIYTRWGVDNELDSLPGYHSLCWEQGKFNLVQVQDPHDRKPWALAWFAVFPNHDVVAVAEWPPFSFKDTVTSPVFDPEEYREIILAAEEEIGWIPDTRLMDPNFGHTPGKGAHGQTIKSVLAGACRKCQKPDNSLPFCGHSLNYLDPPDSIPEGHMLVRRAIGEPEKLLRPKVYALKEACPNFCYGMRHYGYREETRAGKAISETPELIYKDFPDLVRYLLLSGYGEYQAPTEPLKWDRQPWGRRTSTIRKEMNYAQRGV